jgi:Bacterial Ig-like domain
MVAALLAAFLAAGVAWAASSITSPTNGARTNATPTFSGAAATGGGTSPSVTVKIYSGATATGTPVRTLTTTRNASTGQWSASVTTGAPPSGPALADGQYTAQAQQGSDPVSSPVTFTADGTGPAVTLVNPPNTNTTHDNTPTVSGAAGNATGDGANVNVKIYAGSGTAGAVVQQFDVARTGATWTTSAAALADGTYTAQATQADDVGNTTTSSANTFKIDTTPPAVTITQPGGATNDATPQLAGAAGNAEGDNATVKVKVFAGATATGTPLQTVDVTRNGTSWSVGASQLAPGTYTAQATQLDNVDNTTSVTKTFTVDTTAPSVTLDKPADGTDSTPTFNGTASDPTSVTLHVYSGGSEIQTLAATPSAGGWTVDASPDLAPGSYAAQATQTDAAGNTGSSALHTFTVSAPVTPSGGGLTPTNPTGPTTPGPTTSTPQDTGPLLLSPFPIVRIVGVLTRTGAKLSLFAVRAPAGSTVQVRCKGRSCPFKVRSSAAGERDRTVRIKRIPGRALRAGVILEVRVSHVDRWGKFTRFRIRKNKSPLRTDACLRPNGLRPVACPA